MQLSLEKERMECLVSSFFSVLEVMPRRFFFHKNVGYYNFPLLPLLPPPCAIATVAMSTLYRGCREQESNKVDPNNLLSHWSLYKRMKY